MEPHMDLYMAYIARGLRPRRASKSNVYGLYSCGTSYGWLPDLVQQNIFMLSTLLNTLITSDAMLS